MLLQKIQSIVGNDTIQVFGPSGSGKTTFVLDSIGFPVLSQFSLADIKRRGDMLLKCVTLTHYLKMATFRHGAIAIVTNQPQSQFGKTAGLDDVQPFGDKSMYGYKEIWRTYLEKASEEETVCSIRTWRSRKYGRGKTLLMLRIADETDVKSFVGGREDVP